LTWAAISEIQTGDTVVVLGQGLVGNLVMQAVRGYQPGQLISVDALASRLEIAKAVGADVLINAAVDDPVARVQELTSGRGAQVVIDCVGGRAGLRSFAQAQEMVADGGTLHLIALYHGETLPLDAGKIQRRRLLGGYYHGAPRSEMVARAVEMVRSGAMRVEPLITHRFHYRKAKAAYDLLYNRPQEALGVLLMWEGSQ
jgi:threonine dehydrogenase-like Zn-dependent dehydrogenase